jgi:hypothetical protein
MTPAHLSKYRFWRCPAFFSDVPGAKRHRRAGGQAPLPKLPKQDEYVSFILIDYLRRRVSSKKSAWKVAQICRFQAMEGLLDPAYHQSIIAGQLAQPPPPQLIGAGSLPPLAGEAIKESCFVRSATPHDGQVGVSDERTSVSNSCPHLLQS